MKAEERQLKIESYLKQAEFASLEELSNEVNVSISTVRRDLTMLEATGSVRRTHGGARLMNPSSDEFIFTKRDMHQLAEKELIGRTCASLIPDGRSVILDAGTTVYHVAKYLEPKSPQIVTNSMPVANLFASTGRAEVILSGGVIYPRLGVLLGPLAVETIRKMHADIAVMSAGGITTDGISNSHVLLIEIQLAMMQAASKVIFCLDHTKFGRKSFSKLCGLDKVDVIVTDEKAPAELVGELRRTGLEVMVSSVPDKDIPQKE